MIHDFAGTDKCKNCGLEYLEYAHSGYALSCNKQESSLKCECGADKTYGANNNLHSAVMPCPLYKAHK